MYVPGNVAGKQPVMILRGTATSQSILVRGVLPLTKEMESGNCALIRGDEMIWIKEPLFNVMLEAGIVSGPVEVRDGQPVGGILGNDVAGDKTNFNPNPIVMKVPRIEEDDGLANMHPGVFSSCVVTHAMAKNLNSTCTLWCTCAEM